LFTLQGAIKMKLKYLGHAAFELTLGDGRSIVFDPYESGAYDGALGYGPIEGAHDIAIVSHAHPDHRFEGVISKAGTVVDKAGEVNLEGIRIKSYDTFHDESMGCERGENLVSIVEAEGIRLVHMGDLGHSISSTDLPELEGIDVMLLPVGGFFTIDAATARSIAGEFSPKIIVPMHFKTDKCGFPIAALEDFTSAMDDVEVPGGSEIELGPDTLPAGGKVVVLEPAL
jgi:L-ascorbate metabolism protein UlaG (beta-lactamase superfamily)